MKKLGLVFILFSLSLFAQGSGAPYNPMTAPGARGIKSYAHILYWINPINVKYNHIFFSNDSIMVYSLDSTAKVFDGFPDIALSEFDLSAVGGLGDFNKYYWRVVEFDSSGYTLGPVWDFRSNFNPTDTFLFEDDFEVLNDEWKISNEGGTCVWQTVPITNNIYVLPIQASGYVFVADADDCGSGTSTLTSARLDFDLEGPLNYFTIEWDNDWNALTLGDSALVEISTDYGFTWQALSVFDQNDVRNSHEFLYFNLNIDNALSIRLRSVQPGYDWWWAIDNFKILYQGPMYIQLPPTLLTAKSNDSLAIVKLNWNRGWTFIEPIISYRIMRKAGLPNSSNLYEVIAQTDSSTLEYLDLNVEEGETYTYKIRSVISTGAVSISGNEATAYVPSIIPVELTSFISSVNENNVTLSWQTTTETNNQGFEVQRKQVFSQQSSVGNEEWIDLDFVNGNGTTTEPQSYLFVDKDLEAGKYNYRLKQIDFDGTFEHSNTIEVEINLPTTFTLKNCFPNPFNPSTKIIYEIPKQSNVLLKVYDILGIEVSILVNEMQSAGNYQIIFDASELANGVYFYRLQADNFIETKKMILLK